MPEGEIEGLPLGEAPTGGGVVEGVGVPVGLARLEEENEGERETEAVLEALALALSAAVGVRVGVREDEPVAVSVELLVSEGVAVGVGVGEAVGAEGEAGPQVAGERNSGRTVPQLQRGAYSPARGS